MRPILQLGLVLAALCGAPAQAQQRVVVSVEEWVEIGGARFSETPAVAAARRSVASYGPFRVLDHGTAALVGGTDGRSPAAFAAMLRDYPAIARLEMLECEGTADDRANLRLGRMIRAAGLTTSVPAGGSVRSGGVELFLAGARRELADGAEFAVHAWEDEDGLEATDYAPDAPQNAKYLAYYREMGMTAAEARAFYAMTNSAPNNGALWLSGREMRPWIERDESQAAPRLAYLDLGLLLP